MPAGMNKKQERQYEHIKDSYKDRGVSDDEAEERAARTVNKQKGKSKKEHTGRASATSASVAEMLRIMPMRFAPSSRLHGLGAAW